MQLALESSCFSDKHRGYVVVNDPTNLFQRSAVIYSGIEFQILVPLNDREWSGGVEREEDDANQEEHWNGKGEWMMMEENKCQLVVRGEECGQRVSGKGSDVRKKK
uniref:TMV resistance protein N-like n=1 Tax=Syphacia muris TaxID=451379 RepID=A0A0N5ARX8_9BILA